MVLCGEKADHKLCKFFYESWSLVNRKLFVNYSDFLFLVDF